ncbi:MULTISPECIES: T6SS phospholipase effector Tle1-like catalytic domain-containing protein [Acinetobacter]|uniref:T6SS phospholipase effector Tle1-like catalytic domain-containing protein n=1 Tax=Acinetobacter TaxID=469 RepID=UPI000646B78C|nr:MULTISPECIES: DUF2235 domain-containing protein [Acinetobacter]MBJ8483495.1 DUF2235 domain-containing protein [Acinetobacter vivianii]
MLSEELKRVANINNDISNDTPTSKQDCSDVVNISVFFDGTGNNKETDEKSGKWSNPARLWRNANEKALSERKDSKSRVTLNHAIYVSGVGTNFNAELGIFQRTISWMQDNLALGSGAGLGGARRLDYGEEQFNDHLKKVLEIKVKSAEKNLSQYATAGKASSETELTQCLSEHRLIKKINISVFGFSRGAALARAFTNQMLGKCESTCDGLTYGEKKSPIEFQFLGIFDTVASFGLPSTNLLNNLTFKGRDMVVDERVKMCVHHVAGNEQRFAFPVDLICKREDGTLANPAWKEVVYPGMHSDVGGGYMPLDEETQITDHFARIPLRDMLNEAVQAGVRMYSYEQLQKEHGDLFKTQFEVLPQVETLYQSVVSDMQSQEATAMQLIQAKNPDQAMKHREQIKAKMMAAMKTYYSAYGTIQRSGEAIATEQERKGTMRRTVDYSVAAFGPASMAEEIRRLRASQNFTASKNGGINIFRVLSPVSKLYEYLISIDGWELESWERDTIQPVADFYQQYVHDSKYGFLFNAEPFSYFYQRTVFEPRRSRQGQEIDKKLSEQKIMCSKDPEVQQQQLMDSFQQSKLDQQQPALDAAS